MKKTVWILAIVAVIAFVVIAIIKNSDKPDYYSLESYVPDEEFSETYNILTTSLSTPKEGYDIEETVKIIYSLEMAQANSESMDELLAVMARQNYNNVADEVILAKERLLPILQRMKNLEQEYKSLTGFWSVARCLAGGFDGEDHSENSKANVAASIVCNLTNIPGAPGSYASLVFDKYGENNELKKKVRREINEVKEAYLNYISEFTPVYQKYSREWDEICLYKDKAYLDFYSGRIADAFESANKVLEMHPSNREALLLKAFSLAYMGSDDYDASESIPGLMDVENGNKIYETSDITNGYLVESNKVLDEYMRLYPDRSAPALIIKGMIHNVSGHVSQAMSYWDQAAIEYPRQAEKLNDLLDSYNMRSYINLTAEGKYLLRLYRSTMEGYGLFSPNFIKARHYADNGEIEKSQEEIFRHFFRRGNQGIYDCLLSDMEFCEDNLANSFNGLLLEHSYIDVEVKPAGKLAKLVNDISTLFSDDDNEYVDVLAKYYNGFKKESKDRDRISVTITNRSDINLENLRVFLCIHYTDMYPDEYDIVKLPTVNVVKSFEKVDVGNIRITYQDKKSSDITRVRAIAMTDDKVCWVDEAEYKNKKAITEVSDVVKTCFANELCLNGEKMKRLLEEKIDVKYVKNGIFSKDEIEFEIPRKFILLDPAFSIYQLQDKERSMLPKSNVLAGDVIRVKFDCPNSQMFPFYITSSIYRYKIDVKCDDNHAQVMEINQI